MEYISKKLVVSGLRAKLFYWDNTALVSSPEAIGKAVEKITLLSRETGLHLKWRKCHLCQLRKFMERFDNVLKKGFESLIGIKLEERWWRLLQLPAKYGGMSLRSGLQTYGAQHLSSLSKSSDDVERIIGSLNLITVAKRDTEEWLNNALEEKVDLVKIMDEIKTQKKISHDPKNERSKEWQVYLFLTATM